MGSPRDGWTLLNTDGASKGNPELLQGAEYFRDNEESGLKDSLKTLGRVLQWSSERRLA